MKKRTIIIIFIIILMVQTIIPQKINASNKTYEINSNSEKIGSQISENSIFGSDITFTTNYVVTEEENVLDYLLCTPSIADDYEAIPLIVWLHGLGDKGDDGSGILSEGFFKAMLRDNSLEGFSAYVLCPNLGSYSMWSAGLIQPVLDKFFQEYNVDKENVIIIGESLGGAGALVVAQGLGEEYFSKCVICSGSGSSVPPVDTRWYVGWYDGDSYKRAARVIENYYGADKEKYVHWFAASHGEVSYYSYLQDTGEFLRYCK